MVDVYGRSDRKAGRLMSARKSVLPSHGVYGRRLSGAPVPVVSPVPVRCCACSGAPIASARRRSAAVDGSRRARVPVMQAARSVIDAGSHLS